MPRVAKTTKTKGVLLTKAKAIKLLDWHGGGGTAVYALGSSNYARHSVPIPIAQKAAQELKRDLSRKPVKGFWRGWTVQDKASIRQRIKDIESAIRVARR